MKGNVSVISLSAPFSFVYRRAIDFFQSILYPSPWLQVFILCITSPVYFLRLLIQTIIVSANKKCLTFSFPIWIPLVLLFVFILLLAEFQEICRIDVEREASLVFFLILVSSLFVPILCLLSGSCSLFLLCLYVFLVSRILFISWICIILFKMLFQNLIIWSY